nr:putative transposase (putative), gypsy type [Tanacetum cinerariifolium]
MPNGKIGVYTRFFEFVNFRLPLSTFIVNVLRHSCINLSQLSVIAAAKVSHFEILCHVHEPFHCLIGMSRNFTLDEDTYLTFLRDDGTEIDLFTFIQVVDPTKVKVGEWEHAEEETRLLDSIIRHVVPLLPIALAHAESELEESVERLFDEGGSTNHGDSTTSGGQDAASCYGRGDYGTFGEVATSGKSPYALKELLASSMLNDEASVTVVVTLPVVTSSVSATPEHKSGAPDDSITGANLLIIGASERFVISSDSSHHYDVAGPSYFTRQDLLMGSWELDAETMHQLFIREMDYHHLFTEFNVGTTRQACLNAEVRMRTEYCLKTEAAKATHLRAQVSAVEATEKIHTNEIDALKQKNVALENEKESLKGKFDGLIDQVYALDTTCFGLCDQVAKLDADLLEMALYLEEIFYPHLLATISGRRWLLTYGLKLAVVKCLNSQGYLSALGAAVRCAIEKVMQDELSAGIDHGKAGRSLANVVAYNLATKADYNSALQRLREPDVDQLMLHVYWTEDQVVLGETSLSFALSLTHLRVERIRENVAAKRYALIGVWTPLVDPLSVENLVGESDTSDGVPTIIATTTAMTTTFAFASSIPPITIEDYEIVGTDGLNDAQGSGQGNAASLPTVEFEKEELDTTPERDPPSLTNLVMVFISFVVTMNHDRLLPFCSGSCA